MFGLVPEPGEISTLSGKPLEAQVDWLLELYRRATHGAPARAAPRCRRRCPGLFDFNQWNANKPGTTLFIPVTNTTLEYINLLFIYLARSYGFSLVDEQPGGARPACSRPSPPAGVDPARQMGIVELEQRVLSMLVVEQAFICQNINLALQAPRVSAAGPSPATSPASSWAAATCPGSASASPRPTHGPDRPGGPGRASSRPSRPPYYADMDEAVDAFMEVKWAAVRRRDARSPTSEPDRVVERRAAPARRTPSSWSRTTASTVYETYGRFPVYLDPMYQRLTVPGPARRPGLLRAYYPPGALTAQHLEHFAAGTPSWPAPTAGRPGARTA